MPFSVHPLQGGTPEAEEGPSSHVLLLPPRRPPPAPAPPLPSPEVTSPDTYAAPLSAPVRPPPHHRSAHGIMGAAGPPRPPLPAGAPARTTTPKNPSLRRGPGVRRGCRAAALSRRRAAPGLRGRGKGRPRRQAARCAEPPSSRRRYDASMGQESRAGLAARALSWQPSHTLASFPHTLRPPSPPLTISPL